MRLACTVDVVNLLASGQTARIVPASKGVVHLVSQRDGNSVIVLSTAKQSQTVQYLVRNVELIRDRFIKNGQITVVMRSPPVNLMIRNANVPDLEKFVKLVKALGDGKLRAGFVEPELGMKTKQTDNSVGTESRLLKRKRSAAHGELINKTTKANEQGPTDVLIPEQCDCDTGLPSAKLSKNEAKDTRKVLRKNHQVLKVSKREDYPLKSGFGRLLVDLHLTGCQLGRVDSRVMELKLLRNLNLSSNAIFSIEPLKRLSSILSSLTLDNNRIQNISPDFFTAPSLASLTSLSLKGNQLLALPRSIVSLKNLHTLILSENLLTYLPYNLHQLTKLLKLLLSGNHLTFIPHTVSVMKLMKLDISGNAFRDTPLNQDEPPARVQHEPFTTLYERAAGFIMTHNYKNRLKPEKCIDVAGAQLPATMLNFLESCKYCLGCGNMSPRYALITKLVTVRELAVETVTENGRVFVPAKRALCDTCLF